MTRITNFFYYFVGTEYRVLKDLNFTENFNVPNETLEFYGMQYSYHNENNKISFTDIEDFFLYYDYYHYRFTHPNSILYPDDFIPTFDFANIFCSYKSRDTNGNFIKDYNGDFVYSIFPICVFPLVDSTKLLKIVDTDLYDNYINSLSIDDALHSLTCLCFEPIRLFYSSFFGFDEDVLYESMLGQIYNGKYINFDYFYSFMLPRFISFLSLFKTVPYGFAIDRSSLQASIDYLYYQFFIGNEDYINAQI